MLMLFKVKDHIDIFFDGSSIGTAWLYNNPFHKRNCYVKLDLKCLHPKISAELFRQLAELAGRPLQVMTESTDSELIRFLESGGFDCKRRCYESDAGEEDFIGGSCCVQLLHAYNGKSEYEQCCKLLYGYYAQTHAAVNPWTAGYETFADQLPSEVIYSTDGQMIDNLAFVEGNEIAYVYGSSLERFRDFASDFAGYLLKRYDRICFESDNCDWAAMELRSLFRNQDESSFDTYILNHSFCEESENNKPMEFRLAKIQDLPALKASCSEVIERMHKDGIQIWNDYYPCELFPEDIEANRLYVLTEGEKIVSAFSLCNGNSGEQAVSWENPAAKAMYIDRFAVNPQFSGRGIGSCMLGYAGEMAKTMGAAYLRLFVVDLNLPAIRLYGKNGFVRAPGVYWEEIRPGEFLCEFGYERKL